MADRNTYKVFVQFKNGKSLDFEIELDTDLRAELLNILTDKQGGFFQIGEYYLDANEILYMRIEGSSEKDSK